MKLYYFPFACAQAVHIALREAELPFTLERVDPATKITATGADFRAVNPLGYVPVLVLDDGATIHEVPALLLHVADLAPEKGLAPPGGLERTRLLEMLSFINSELHKGFSPLFSQRAGDDYKDFVRETLGKRYAQLDARLAAQPYLLGQTFTVADAYLFVVLGWTRAVRYDLAPFPNLKAFVARVGERPAVQAAVAAEKAKA